MPLYTYRCARGHVAEHFHGVNAERPSHCNHPLPDTIDGLAQLVCGKPLERIISAPASVFPGADKWRR
jgi:hypothetical protein